MWAALAYAVASFLSTALRKDNPVLPWALSPARKAALLGGLSLAASAALATLGGTPWWQAVGATFGPAITAYGTHGVRSGAAVIVLVLSIATGSTACTPAQGAADERLAGCILARATLDVLSGMPDAQIPADVAAYCVTEESNVVGSLSEAHKRANTIIAKPQGGRQ